MKALLDRLRAAFAYDPAPFAYDDPPPSPTDPGDRMIIYATVTCPGCQEPVANDYEIRSAPSSLFEHPVPPSIPLELVADGQTYSCRSCGLELVTVLSFDTSQP